LAALLDAASGPPEQADRRRDRRTAGKGAQLWAEREADTQRRWQAHVVPECGRPDLEIARLQPTLSAAARLEEREAAVRAVVDRALQQRNDARALVGRLASERNRLDGVPSAAEIRRGATRAHHQQGFCQIPEPTVWELSSCPTTSRA
jgi:hypothetical protein